MFIYFKKKREKKKTHKKTTVIEDKTHKTKKINKR